MSDIEHEGTELPRQPNKRCGHGGHGDYAWWDERPLPVKFAMIVGGGALVVGLLVLFGFVTMWLWNWLMPEIFGLKAITYWQAWGLILLSAIFFKRPGGGGHRTERRRKRELRRRMGEAE